MLSMELKFYFCCFESKLSFITISSITNHYFSGGNMGNTYQSTIINASPDSIWHAIKDFHDLSWAPNVVTKVDVIGDADGGQVGAKRVLNDAFHETLLEVDEAGHTIKYSIDAGPGPLEGDGVTNYVGSVQIRPVTDSSGSFVEWASDWDGEHTACHDFCGPIYVALLGDMKASLEG